MSIADKITRLQAAKTAIGTAITAKGGTVAAGDGFEDFAADVGTIPAGGGTDYFRHMTSPNFFKMFNGSTNIPARMDLYLDSVVEANSWKYAFSRTNNNNPTTDLYIHLPQNPISGTYNFEQMMFQAYGIKELHIDGDLTKVISYGHNYGLFAWGWNTEVIDIDFDFSGVDRDQEIASYGDVYKVTSLRFKPNTLSYSLNISAFPNIDNASIIAAANCLKDGITGKTIRFHATPKGKCNTIVGTVALDVTETYHIFTADAGGTVTLADFITDTKGWTIA